jgi:hypothetical protein
MLVLYTVMKLLLPLRLMLAWALLQTPVQEVPSISSSRTRMIVVFTVTTELGQEAPVVIEAGKPVGVINHLVGQREPVVTLTVKVGFCAP